MKIMEMGQNLQFFQIQYEKLLKTVFSQNFMSNVNFLTVLAIKTNGKLVMGFFVDKTNRKFGFSSKSYPRKCQYKICRIFLSIDEFLTCPKSWDFQFKRELTSLTGRKMKMKVNIPIGVKFHENFENEVGFCLSWRFDLQKSKLCHNLTAKNKNKNTKDMKIWKYNKNG